MLGAMAQYDWRDPYCLEGQPAGWMAGIEDGVAGLRVAVLRRMGTEVEYHRYPGVGHGFGLGGGTSAEGWIEDAVRFWARHAEQPGRLTEGLR